MYQPEMGPSIIPGRIKRAEASCVQGFADVVSLKPGYLPQVGPGKAPPYTYVLAIMDSYRYVILQLDT